MAAVAGRRRGAIHGINITPLVDILLVLLVLVLATGTLTSPRSLDLELPRAEAAKAAPERPTGISLARDGALSMDGEPATEESIRIRIRERTAADSLHRVLVAAHRDLPYRQVVRALDLVRSAGASRYALQVEDGN